MSIFRNEKDGRYTVLGYLVYFICGLMEYSKVTIKATFDIYVGVIVITLLLATLNYAIAIFLFKHVLNILILHFILSVLGCSISALIKRIKNNKNRNPITPENFLVLLLYSCA